VTSGSVLVTYHPSLRLESSLFTTIIFSLGNFVMQSNRQPKWDWATHFDWMLDLYLKGATIPQIHKATVALECDTFRPW
jgi:hypothetical protein